MSRSPVHFLLVEDDDSHAELVRLVVEETGYRDTVDRVADGPAALAYLRREGAYAEARRPAAVLLDLRLGATDGHEVLQEIKADPQLRATPVIVLSSSDGDRDRARAYANYANSFLVKPLDFDDYQILIRDLRAYWGGHNRPAPPVL